jgi:histidine triad (HIT) family protein
VDVDADVDTADYDCPFCRIVSRGDWTGESTVQDDIVYRGDEVTAFIASSWWPANPGHVLVVPNEHYRNVYDIPEDLLAAVQVMGKHVAFGASTPSEAPARRRPAWST